jgi:hypothetical protein
MFAELNPSGLRLVKNNAATLSVVLNNSELLLVRERPDFITPIALVIRANYHHEQAVQSTTFRLRLCSTSRLKPVL